MVKLLDCPELMAEIQIELIHSSGQKVIDRCFSDDGRCAYTVVGHGANKYIYIMIVFSSISCISD